MTGRIKHDPIGLTITRSYSVLRKHPAAGKNIRDKHIWFAVFDRYLNPSAQVLWRVYSLLYSFHKHLFRTQNCWTYCHKMSAMKTLAHLEIWQRLRVLVSKRRPWISRAYFYLLTMQNIVMRLFLFARSS